MESKSALPGVHAAWKYAQNNLRLVHLDTLCPHALPQRFSAVTASTHQIRWKLNMATAVVRRSKRLGQSPPAFQEA